MKQQLAVLRTLQSKDDGIRSTDEQTARLRQQVRELDNQLADLHGSLKSTTEDSKVTTISLKNKEGELKGVEEHIHKLQAQLNAAGSNKEFTALKHEIATARQKTSALEDDILQLMERLEGGGEKIRKLQEDIRRRESEIQAKKEDIEKRLAALEEHLAQLSRERRQAAEAVEPGFLAVYERIHKGQPDGKAVVAASNFICTGCNMTVPSNVVNHLMQDEKLITCKSCQRILYLDDGRT